MTKTEAEAVRDELKRLGVDAWTEDVVPNRHGVAVAYRAGTREAGGITLVGKRMALTPEEGRDLVAEVKAGSGVLT